LNDARAGRIVSRERIAIEIASGEDGHLLGTVSAVLALPEGPPASAVLVAHGAGQDMESPLCVAVADGLCAAGHLTLRFNFLYKESGRRAPDRPPVLEATVRAAAELLRPRASRLVLAGKSMGGRYASIVASKGLRCDGLFFLGYPLHPAGKPEKLRDAHLDQVAQSMLFLQGTRDPLCRLDLLAPVLDRLGERASLHVVEGGDHSLDVRRRGAGAGVRGEIVTTIDRWIRGLRERTVGRRGRIA
jgi:uncharacterized protein